MVEFVHAVSADWSCMLRRATITSRSRREESAGVAKGDFQRAAKPADFEKVQEILTTVSESVT